MRRKDVLFKLEDISILLQYLYMSEAHSVVINNGLTDLRIRLDENLNAWCQNLTFPDTPELRFDTELSPEGCVDIIWELSQHPAVEFPDRFDNRWDEIKELTRANMSLNIGW